MKKKTNTKKIIALILLFSVPLIVFLIFYFAFNWSWQSALGCSLFVFFGVSVLTLELINPTPKYIQFVNNLTVDDFTFIGNSYTANIFVSDISISKKMNLDKSFVYIFQFPKVNEMSLLSNKIELEIKENSYKRYANFLKDIDIIEVEIFTLTAIMKSGKYSSLTNYDVEDKNLFSKRKFTTERYNIPNFITGIKPFSSENYEWFTELIKEDLNG